MTLTCVICKKFISTSGSLQCSHNSTHLFHPDCVKSSKKLPAGVVLTNDDCMPCVTCEEPYSSRNAGNTNLDTQTNDDSLKSMLRTLILKVSNIETQLGSLATIDSRLESVEAGVKQCIFVCQLKKSHGQ